MTLEAYRWLCWAGIASCGAFIPMLAFGVNIINHKITVRDALAAIPHMPEFRLTALTDGIKLWANDAGITSKDSDELRMYKLEIENVSKIPVSHLQLRIQFPEPIIKLKSNASAEMQFTTTQIWDEPLIRVTGGMPAVKKFGDQSTGLWRIDAGRLPGETSLKVEFITSIGEGAEMYYGATGGPYKEGMQIREGGANPPYIWFLSGSFQFDKGPRNETKNFIVPLIYDRRVRQIEALPAIENSLNPTNWLEISFIPGVDLGNMKSMGSILIKPPGPILGNPNLKPTIVIEKGGKGSSAARSSAENDGR